MKKAYIITSCIEPDNTQPLTYSGTRSAFSPEERFRQTVFTLAALDLIADQDTKIYLIDASENWQNYRDVLGYCPNLVFVGVKEQFPEIFSACRIHPNKSYSENLMLATFLTKYKEELKNFDYFIKLSGRYFFDSYFDRSVFNEFNTNKLFFKHPVEFEFNESWNFKMVDRRAIQGNNKFYWYCSAIFAWGKDYNSRMLDMFRVMSLILTHPSGNHYQSETLLYFFTREYEKDIIHVDWKVIGFDGVGGIFIRY